MTADHVNLDQKRAAFAWTRLKQHGVTQEYANLAKSAPALVMTSGLMQVLAFLQDKADNKKSEPARVLAEDLRAWLGETVTALDLQPGAGGDPGYVATMEALYAADVRTYRRATNEALAILRWLRQFAPTLVDDKEAS